MSLLVNYHIDIHTLLSDKSAFLPAVNVFLFEPVLHIFFQLFVIDEFLEW